MMPKESITGTPALSGPTAIAAGVASRRPLLCAMVLSAILHAAVLGGAIFAPTDPAAQRTPAALEIVVLDAAPVTATNRAGEVAADNPVGARDGTPDTGAVAPTALPVVPPTPILPVRTPVLVSRAETSYQLEITSDIADVGITSEVEAWVPQHATLAWQTGERAMLRERVERWLENPAQLLNQDEPLRWEHDGRQYQASVRHSPAESATDLDRAVVEISTEHAGQRVFSRTQLQRRSFSHYAQFVNHWDPDVLLSQDSITGRFHANTAINISTGRGTAPLFQGPVSIATSMRQARSLLAAGVFAGGLETEVGQIHLPTVAMPLAGAEARADIPKQQRPAPHYFDKSAWITFYASGEYSWQYSADGPMEGRRPTTGNTVYLFGNDGATLSVEGQLAGHVIVYSPHRISITGHLRYANDPKGSTASPDLLSLISDHTIQIETQRFTGPGDLHVQAAIYAGRRFSVRQFRTRNNGILYIYGSVVAGSMSATEPRYATNIEFDQRLESIRAPGFPMTDRYALESQDEHWRLVMQ